MRSLTVGLVFLAILGLHAERLATGQEKGQPPAPGKGQAKGTPAETVPMVSFKCGKLVVRFEDNSGGLSGLRSLVHTAKPEVAAFVMGGLNYEHVISGVPDKRNRFTPRQGPFRLRRHPRGVSLHRKKEDCPWGVPVVLKYTVTPPHFVDFEFEATITDAAQFKADEVTFFFASYVTPPDDYEIHFKGIPYPDAPERWVASTPAGDAKSTTYAADGAPDLARDPKDRWHNLHLTKRYYPRIAKPFYYGRAASGMVYAVMFDRLLTDEEEMRFSVFRWRASRPAWDFEYVARKLANGKKVGFKGRLVWKPFVSAEEIEKMYEAWKPR